MWPPYLLLTSNRSTVHKTLIEITFLFLSVFRPPGPGLLAVLGFGLELVLAGGYWVSVLPLMEVMIVRW